MDDIARYNQERWQQLNQVNALFTRPKTDLTPETARELIDPENRFGDLVGKSVLCLAGGGGKQSVAFALLGADVTVFDLSEAQLDKDRAMAEHYGLQLTVQQGDMRDLSAFAENTFDLIDHPYSINFVPDVSVVFEQVARVIKPKGDYRLMCANPISVGVSQSDWDGTAYPIRHPYHQSEPFHIADPDWVADGHDLLPPKEFRHTLSHLVGGLSGKGFVIKQLDEVMAILASTEAKPGSWDHFTAFIPPYLTFHTIWQPEQM